MSILKFETRTPRILRGMYNYLLDPTKTSEDGIFTIGCNPRFVVEEFEFVQKVYLREQIIHPYLQVIFSFDKNIALPLYVIKEISMKIGLILILDRRQVFAAIHYLGKAAQKIHCHYIVNPHPTKVGRFQVSFKETDCLSTIRFKLRYLLPKLQAPHLN